MKRFIPFLILVLILTLFPPGGSSANTSAVLLGSDVLFSQFPQVIKGKKLGLVTNQTGINSKGTSTIDALRREKNVQLAALYTPEHGLDGKTPAGQYVKSYKHPVYGIPVNSLYGATRKPTPEMLAGIDVLLVDLQDIGARTYTYISTLQYCMTAAKEQGKPIVVLDRPNPVGGTIVDGPVLEPEFRSFVGVDELPMAHGMTIGELAQYFNRSIGADLTVIPMKGYTRQMIFQDTGLNWIPSSPRIPDLSAVFGYMATGLGEGTGITQADNFRWIGGDGIDSGKYADSLNGALLPGVVFLPEDKDKMGGVRLQITDPHQFNPAKTGLYALTYAYQLHPFQVPKSGKAKTMFDLVMGSNKIGQYLEEGLSPQQIEQKLAHDLEAFRKLRESYLIYTDIPFMPVEPIHQKAQPSQSQTASSAQPVQTTQPAQTSPPVQSNAQQPNAPGQAQSTPPALPEQPAPGSSLPSEGQNPHQPDASKQTEDKVAYLTFDDGPSPITKEVLDILKQYDIKATFFVVGTSIHGHEDLLKRTIAEGHVVGGHTYSHNYRSIYKDITAFFADLEKGNELIESVTGIKPLVFRYPGGSTNTISKTYQDPARYNSKQTVMSAIKTEATKRGYTFIDWNITNGDARSNKYTPDNALANIKQQVKNQKEIVVLMHDSSTKASTAKSLPAVIQFLKDHGYRFDTIHPEKSTVATVK
ncbi:DUF1343 domain-containing protein [Brevibacillus ruminantium]|uniref:DUF1343 domain-containing protein n=1 Tax=Brevibacillus ruminantium TaxID=2950604 RepID=A0ABY4WAM3_9BACL|nr:exo-beta-N-acetylmuramidase NamZ domain-containing protein [Brevibacillus ruminantium]USG63824.1 DUF1343 domain-containing protein [Brevibacillus ruminantium]